MRSPSIWNWPAGLVQVCLYAWIFFQARLYSDFILHLVYIVLQIYGWVHWLRGGTRDDRPLPITRLAGQRLVTWLIVAGVASAGIGYVMHRYADAAIPYGDAAILVLSLVAQYLLARKVLETWLFWIAVDLLALGVYAAKELYITTGLYSVFLVLAIIGWYRWRQSVQGQRRMWPDPIPAPTAAAAD